MNPVLTADFFKRDALLVAPDLIGKYLVRKVGEVTVALLITEVEAYDGHHDRASHGRFGKTKRTAPMFEEGGCFYVYLIYGMHWMLNIVTGTEGYPAALLIRGAGHLSGPGRLTRFLSINQSFNGVLANKTSGLWFEKRASSDEYRITRTPRIGIDYAGQEWSQAPYRFVLTKSINSKC